MSLPLSRRIVQAALVVAAGAVPAVAAGAACAAPALPNVPDLGGFSQLDTAGLAGNVQNAANQAGGLTGSNATGTVAGAVPMVTDVTGAAAGKAVPAASRVLGQAAGQLTQAAGSTTSTTGTLGGTTGGATRSMPLGMASEVAPAGAGSPVQANLSPSSTAPNSPLSSLPLNSLPLSAAQGALGHLTGAAAPAQRLGGLPGLGDAGGLGSVTQALPLAGSLPIG